MNVQTKLKRISCGSEVAKKGILAMTPRLIPVSETYEALAAGVRKTAAMRACMVFKTSSTFENFPAVTAYVLGVYHA